MPTLEDEVTEFMTDWDSPRGGLPSGGAKPPKKMAPRHEQIINWFIANPHRSNGDCAAFFGVTQAWLSTIKRSDAYKARMAQRLDEMAEDMREAYIAQMNMDTLGRLNVAAEIALEKLTEKLEIAEDPEFLLDATDKLCHRLGFAPKSTPVTAGSLSVTNNTVNIAISSDDLAAARQLLQRPKLLTVEGPAGE